MWLDIFWISLWGGVVSLDTTAMLQIMISRPIVSCTISGLILGNFPLGFTMGILLELLYIDQLPIGAAKFAENNVGSTAATAVAVITANQFIDRDIPAIAFSILIALYISTFGGMLVSRMRQANGKLYDNLLKSEKITIRKITLTHFLGIGRAYLLGFFCIFSTSLIFGTLLPFIVRLIPTQFDKIIAPVQGGILAAGCMSLVQIFWAKNQKKWIIILGIGVGVLYFL